MTDDRDARIAELEGQLERLTLDRAQIRSEYQAQMTEQSKLLKADLADARAEIERLLAANVDLVNRMSDLVAEKDALRAQLDTARTGLVAAHDCLARAMMRARDGTGAEWAGIHSELFCGVRDADQALASLPAQPAPTETS